jgi:tRNA(Ile)-lysidine synthase TilS/MesJ/signal peptidase I
MIILHYPGMYHDRVSLKKKISFKEFWSGYSNTYKALGEYGTFEAFFSRFLLYLNGVRIYHWDFDIEPEDTIIMISANKLSLPIRYSEVKQPFKTCDFCSGTDIAYVDFLDERLDKYIGVAYCCKCFKDMMEKKAFSNLKMSSIPKGAAVDLGLSGERDSSMALYFVLLYREKYNLDFTLNCVYNYIGLDQYDKNRLEGIETGIKKRLEKDNFTVNSLNLPILKVLEDIKENKKTTYGLCNHCYRGGRFREYCSYIDTDLCGTTGGGTIEDKIVGMLLNPNTSSGLTVLDYSLPLFREKRWLTPLEGISEDCLSLYAALEKIDYCIDDCPVSAVSTLYHSRRYILNNLKAIFPEFKKVYGDRPLKHNYTLFGQLDKTRQVSYQSGLLKCPVCKGYHDLGNLTLKEVTTSSRIDVNPINELDKKLEDLYYESEENWYKINIDENISAEDLNEIDLLIELPPFYQIISRDCFMLAINSIAENIVVIPTPFKFEKDIIGRIMDAGKPLHLKAILKEYPAADHMPIFKSIHKLLVKGILQKHTPIPPGIGGDTAYWNGLLLDDCDIFDDKDADLFHLLTYHNRGFNIKKTRLENFFNRSTSAEEIFKDNDLILINSLNEKNFRNIWDLSREYNYRGDIVYIFPSPNMTIGMGCYNCLNPGTDEKLEIGINDQIQKYGQVLKIHILSILNDFYSFDNCSRLNGWDRKNMLYYVNLNLAKKTKELVICNCS